LLCKRLLFFHGHPLFPHKGFYFFTSGFYFFTRGFYFDTDGFLFSPKETHVTGLSKRRITFAFISLFGLLTYGVYTYARPLWVPLYRQVQGERSVQDVVQLYGKAAQERLKPFFSEAKAPYPPSHITLLAIKDEKKLELWSDEPDERFFIRSYPIKAASGDTGPKLKEGDRQVPEGIYQLEYLNPNSLYHLSMKLDYPNAFDRAMAQREKRSQLGGDIFIHGNAVSIGCLAMGDRAIEELFTLVAQMGRKNVTVIIAPTDPRKVDLAPLAQHQPAWVAELYSRISQAFLRYEIFPKQSASNAASTFMQKCH